MTATATDAESKARPNPTTHLTPFLQSIARTQAGKASLLRIEAPRRPIRREIPVGPFGVGHRGASLSSSREERADRRSAETVRASMSPTAPVSARAAAARSSLWQRPRGSVEEEEAGRRRPIIRASSPGPMIGWSRRRRRLIVAPLFVLIALLLLAAAAAPRAWAQQEEEDSSGSSSGSSSGIGEADVTSSGGVLEDGSKAWTWSDPGVDGVGGGGGGGGGEDFSGNKTGTLSHKRVPPEEDPDYLAKAQAIRDKEGRDPVVVLNGLGGAGLKFRLRGARPTHHYCRTWYARWHTAWILPRVILPPVARCLVDFITPVYDPATQTFASKPGVEVEVKGFGQIVSLENLGPSLLPLDNFDYIRGFVKFMMTELHYTPGIDLFAAPYDWRYSPDVLKAQGYFTRLQALVESAYVSSGNRRVHLIGHSLGGVVALAFLNDMGLAWKRTYIKSYIPVGAPFGGTLMNLLGSVSGYNLGIPLNPVDLRDFEAFSPTGPWLFPRPCLWGPDEVLVQTPSKNYTSGDYECLLQDLGLHDAVPIFRHVFPQYLATLVPPGIDVHVVHAEGQPTVAALVYNESFSGQRADVPKPPVYLYGPGDGTVPERSLLRPLYEWATQAGAQAGWELTHHTFTGVDHMDSMNYRPFFRVLTDILSDAAPHTPPSPEAAAAVKPPDWAWVVRKRWEAWDPLQEAWDAAEKALDGQWPWG